MSIRTTLILAGAVIVLSTATRIYREYKIRKSTEQMMESVNEWMNSGALKKAIRDGINNAKANVESN